MNKSFRTNKSSVSKNIPEIQTKNRLKKTDWEPVAEWYTHYLNNDPDSYHAKVIVPNLIRLLGTLNNKIILDVGCGEGSITTILAEQAKHVDGFDASASLVEAAKKQKTKATFFVHDSRITIPRKHGLYDHAVCVLAIQNMDNLHAVLSNIYDALKPDGVFSLVTIHPAFRVPQESDWHYEEKRQAQGRVTYTYLSEKKISIVLAPSQRNSAHTTTFHRPLQVYAKCLQNAGFLIRRIEEWISHKESQKGPRQHIEDTARKEIPMFMYIEVVKGK